SETQHTVDVYATDSAGNAANATFTFTTDSTAPAITLVSAATIGQSSAEITLNITDAHGIDTAFYVWDNGTTNHTMLAPYTLLFAATEGAHILHVWAEDEPGNWGTYTGTFTTDNTAPTAEITGLTDGMEVSGALTVTVTPQDANGITRVEFLVEGSSDSNATAAPYTWAWDSTTVADGERTLTIRVYDPAGNLLAEAFEVQVVNEPAEDDIAGLLLIGGAALVSVSIAGGGGIYLARRWRRPSGDGE
ncbi:MAG: Ig-like domain-containing protein, partial [Candidatus Hodarchaeota archaeon]